MMSFKIRTRLSLLIISLVIVLTSTTFAIYRRAISVQERELHQSMISMARIMSIKMDGDNLLQVKPERASEKTALYQEIKQVLQRLLIV